MSRTPRTCRCGRSTGMTSISVLRASGWRLYDGKSLTGKDISDTICPWCAGTTDKPAPGWRVGCYTCDWEWEDEYEEGPLDEKTANRMAMDHECEPETWTKAPVVEVVERTDPVATGALL